MDFDRPTGFLEFMDGGWAAARADAAREENDPFASEGGGEMLVLFQRNDGDWDRIAKSPEILQPLIDWYAGPTGRIHGVRLMRHEDRDIRLLRALSIVTGWAIDDLWSKLLKRLHELMEQAHAADVQVAARAGRHMAPGTRLRQIVDAGICHQSVWLEMLNLWWPHHGRTGQWSVQTTPSVSLSWDELPTSAMLGPSMVQWMGAEHTGDTPHVSALINGVLNDIDRTAFGASMYFFITLDTEAV